MSALPWLLPPLCYAAVVFRLGSALGRNDDAAPAVETESAPSGLTVILACRNEEALIGQTLAALRQQDLPYHRLQIITVDDGSTDRTTALLAEAARLPGPEMRVLSTTPEARGKKHAILRALEQASHPVVAVLDADTAVGPRWARTLLGAFGPEVGLVAGGAVFHPDPHLPGSLAGQALFQRVLRLEYMGLLGAGLAGFALGQPYFASGANLAWRRAAFADAGGFEGLEHVPSGDDTLLIQRMATRTTWQLRPLLHTDARVLTRGPAGFGELLRQRVRWTSTGTHYPNPVALLAALLVAFTCLEMVLLPVLALLGRVSVWVALAAVLLKFLPDLRLVTRAARILGEPRLARLFPAAWLLQLGYAFLLPFAGRGSLRRWRRS